MSPQSPLRPLSGVAFAIDMHGPAGGASALRTAGALALRLSFWVLPSEFAWGTPVL